MLKRLINRINNRRNIQRRLEAAIASHPETTLRHAYEYLQPYGIGRDFEHANARFAINFAHKSITGTDIQ